MLLVPGPSCLHIDQVVLPVIEVNEFSSCRLHTCTKLVGNNGLMFNVWVECGTTNMPRKCVENSCIWNSHLVLEETTYFDNDNLL